MYTLVPEKYLPTRYVDNVAYYPDGTYQHKIASYNFLFSSPNSYPANFNQLIVPTDRTESTEPSLSGVRTVRNIVIKGTATHADFAFGDLTFPAYFSFFYGLMVIRQAQLAPNDRDTLAVHRNESTVTPRDKHSYFTEEDEWTLVYPGTINLYSGDYIQVALQIANSQPSKVQLYGSSIFDVSYDIKYN